MAKIVYGDQARQAVLRGINQLDAVARSPKDVKARQKGNAAIEQYLAILRQGVGEHLAARFENALWAFRKANDQIEALQGLYETIGGLQDSADDEFLSRLHDKAERAARAYEEVSAELGRVLTERDKGGA